MMVSKLLWIPHECYLYFRVESRFAVVCGGFVVDFGGSCGLYPCEQGWF